MDDSDRLLSEKELMKLINERCGLDGVKFREIVRDCPAASALPLQCGDKGNE